MGLFLFGRETMARKLNEKIQRTLPYKLYYFICEDAQSNLDIEKVTPHTMRHTAITHLVQNGVDLLTVQHISGHKTLKMVQHYFHQNGKHIDDAMSKLEKAYKTTSQKD